MNPSKEAQEVAEAICAELCQPTAARSIALFIDRELQLPQRNAALLTAQTIIDSLDGNAPDSGMYVVDVELLDNLREALTRIQNPSSSAGACVQNVYKEPGSKPPQAVEDPPHSPS